MPDSDVKKRRSVDLSLLLVAVVWGSSYLTAKSLLAVMGVLTLLTLRFALTTGALGVLWLVRRSQVTRREVTISLALGVVQLVIFVLETNGVQRTSATNAGLIISLAIVLTPLLEGIARKSWLPAPFFVATTVAVTGVALLVSSHGFHSPTVGDALMLAAAFTRALHVTLMGHLTKGYDYSSLFMTFVQCAVCAFCFAAVGTPGAIHVLGLLTATQWFGLVFLGLACSVFGFLVQLWAIRLTSASRASLLLGTEPVWAVLVAIVVGHEGLAALGVVGAGLIVASTYVAQGVETRHRNHARTSPVESSASAQRG